MGGKMPPEYWREYRKRRRQSGSPVRRRPGYVRPARDYAAEYARSLVLHPLAAVVANEPLPLLMPELQHGVAISYWEDELRLDLAQERALAVLEGRDPEAAVKVYRGRERNWLGHIGPLVEEVLAA